MTNADLEEEDKPMRLRIDRRAKPGMLLIIIDPGHGCNIVQTWASAAEVQKLISSSDGVDAKLTVYPCGNIESKLIAIADDISTGRRFGMEFKTSLLCARSGAVLQAIDRQEPQYIHRSMPIPWECFVTDNWSEISL